MKPFTKAALVIAAVTVPGIWLALLGYHVYKLWRKKNEENKRRMV
jgi:hypothetical protein